MTSGRQHRVYVSICCQPIVLAASPARAKKLEAAFARDGLGLWRIGQVGAAGAGAIAVG